MSSNSGHPSALAAPKVSVLLLTYNHELYLAAALEGALAQHTNFPFEIVLGEDGSADGTRAIAQVYAERYPEIIRPIFRERNIGAARNYAESLACCRGTYLAFLEGDDLWTFHHKLQRQVDHMENHPECSMCFHDARVVDAEGREVSPNFRPFAPLPGALDVVGIMSRNPIPTCSVLYRRSVLPAMPPEFLTLRVSDWATWLLLAARGTVTFFPEAWSAYRVHSTSSWSSRDDGARNSALVDFFATIGRLLEAEPHPQAASWRSLAVRQEKRHLDCLIQWLVERGRWREARPAVIRHLFGGSPRYSLPAWSRATLYLRILFGVPSKLMKEMTTGPGEHRPK